MSKIEQVGELTAKSDRLGQIISERDSLIWRVGNGTVDIRNGLDEAYRVVCTREKIVGSKKRIIDKKLATDTELDSLRDEIVEEQKRTEALEKFSKIEKLAGEGFVESDIVEKYRNELISKGYIVNEKPLSTQEEHRTILTEITAKKTDISQEFKISSIYKPDSPPVQHEDLATLSPYVKGRNARELDKDISKYNILLSNSQEMSIMTKNIGVLLPDVAVNSYCHQFSDSEKRLTIIEVNNAAEFLKSFLDGKISVPTMAEMAIKSSIQNASIELYVKMLTANCLLKQINEPEISEKDLMMYYTENITKNLRRLAENMSSGNTEAEINDAYERLGIVIENMSYVDRMLVVSRMSTELYTDLGFPAVGDISEKRIAEIFRNVSGSFGRKGSDFLSKLEEEIILRVDEGRFDDNTFFDHLYSLKHVNQIIDYLPQYFSEDFCIAFFEIKRGYDMAN